MTLEKVTKMAYSINLHKKDLDYNAIKYNYNISPNMNKRLEQYFNQHKFNLQCFTCYEPKQVQMRLIISYFIMNKQIPCDCSNVDYELFLSSLTEYKNEFDIWFNTFNSHLHELTPKFLYRLYSTKQIPFYMFYYCLKHIKFKESFLEQELIKRKVIETTKLMMFFKHFDEEYIKNKCKILEKAINLSIN